MTSASAVQRLRRWCARRGRREGQHRLDGVGRRFRAVGEGAGLVLAARAQQQPHALQAQPVQLVDRAQHRELLALVLAAEADVSRPLRSLRLLILST